MKNEESRDRPRYAHTEYNTINNVTEPSCHWHQHWSLSIEHWCCLLFYGNALTIENDQ